MLNRLNAPAEESVSRGVSMMIRLCCKSDRMKDFYPLLLRGVMLRAEQGATVRSVLSGQLKMTDEELCRRARAIFLNGKTVAQPDTAVLQPGSTLAISTCLTEPFLLHAYGDVETRVLRPYESARPSSDVGRAKEHISFFLKLFDLMLDRFGSRILSSGVWMDARDFEKFLSERPEHFWEGLENAIVDGEAIAPEALRRLPGSRWSGIIGLTVQEAPGDQASDWAYHICS